MALRNSPGNEVAIELAADLIVEDEFQSKVMHARLLLRIHGVEEGQGFLDIRHDPKRRSRVATEDAPASRQLHSLDRGAVSLKVIADHDKVAVQRAGTRTSQRRQRIWLAVNISLLLPSANDIDPLLPSPHSDRHRLAQCARPYPYPRHS